MLAASFPSKVFTPVCYRADCLYRSSALISSKVFIEYSLSGIIVQAVNFFTTNCLIIDKIMLCDPITGEVMHTEKINGPGPSEYKVSIDRWLENRREERSYLAKFSGPLAKQPA